MNVQKLKGKIVENGLSVETLASMVGTTKSTLYRKLKKSEGITIGEARKIKAALNLTEAEATDIFFG